MIKFLLIFFGFSGHIFAATPIGPKKKAAADKAADTGFYPGLTLGLGFKTFSTVISAGYGFTPWFATEVHIFYRQVLDGPNYEKAYGSETDAIFKFANPSLVTPFVGGGIGYAKWQRMLDNQEFDLAASPFWDYFLGVEARFTPFLSLVGQGKWINYIRPPKDYSDTDSFELNNQYQFTVGFLSRLNFGD